ncbi:UNVERIFIED_ORG: hypothetical protein J2X79_001966 [Arthrobacter globiformis]|nr:hypothetical protein [Arthrobacter globiformis]
MWDDRLEESSSVASLSQNTGTPKGHTLHDADQASCSQRLAVLLYRQMIPASKLAVGAGVPDSVIRYHLAMAIKQEPGIRAEHETVLAASAQRVTGAGQGNTEDISAFCQTESRLAVTGRWKRELAQAGWLTRAPRVHQGSSRSPLAG